MTQANQTAKNETAKRASRKGATKGAAAPAPVDARTEALAKFEALRETLASALDKRIAAADNDNQRNYLTQQRKRLNTANEFYALETKGIDAAQIVENFAAQVAICDKGDARYVAQYALDKVRKCVSALADGILTEGRAKRFDPYTLSIFKNMMKNDGSLSALDALRSLSMQVQAGDENAVALASRLSCVATTASTQRSSTRAMVRFMQICDTSKGARDEALRFIEGSPVVARLLEVFSAAK